MEETFYKRVNYPENKPENKLQEGGSPIPYTVYCESNVPEIDYWFKDNEEWGWLHSVNVTHFLKPLPILSRDNIIEVINKIMPCNCHAAYKDRGLAAPDCPNCNYAEDLADAILKSGLPEKKDIEEDCDDENVPLSFEKWIEKYHKGIDIDSAKEVLEYTYKCYLSRF